LVLYFSFNFSNYCTVTFTIRKNDLARDFDTLDCEIHTNEQRFVFSDVYFIYKQESLVLLPYKLTDIFAKKLETITSRAKAGAGSDVVNQTNGPM